MALKQLRVIYQGWGECWPLGTLADDGRHLLFEYSPEALRQGLELSPLRLKLRPQAYGGFAEHQFHLPGLVADALPDGWGLLLMDRLFRQQGLRPHQLSALDRLAFIGPRAMGALGFEPVQASALDAADVNLLALAREAQAVLAEPPAAHTEPGEAPATVLRRLALLGGSPQGARPKVLVQVNAQTGEVSTETRPGFAPWLVKFQAAGEHPEVCALECLYADLARACGLEMPDTRLFTLSPALAAFGVARFDRVAQPGADGGMIWQRVPVHTLAGALHADHRLPGALDYTTLLRATRFFTQDEREVRKAFERAVFNVLFHNRDDHAKNFAFRLNTQRRWELAPAYDLTFSHGPGGQHHTDVCGHGQGITRAHLLRLAQEGGVKITDAQAVLERMQAAAADLPRHAERWPMRRQTLAVVMRAVQSCARV